MMVSSKVENKWDKDKRVVEAYTILYIIIALAQPAVFFFVFTPHVIRPVYDITVVMLYFNSIILYQ